MSARPTIEQQNARGRVHLDLYRERMQLQQQQQRNDAAINAMYPQQPPSSSKRKSKQSSSNLGAEMLAATPISTAPFPVLPPVDDLARDFAESERRRLMHNPNTVRFA